MPFKPQLFLCIFAFHPHTNRVCRWGRRVKILRNSVCSVDVLTGKTECLACDDSICHYLLCLASESVSFFIYMSRLCNVRRGQNSVNTNLAARVFCICSHKSIVTIPLLMRNRGIRMCYRGHCCIVKHSRWFCTRPSHIYLNPTMVKVGNALIIVMLVWSIDRLMTLSQLLHLPLDCSVCGASNF